MMEVAARIISYKRSCFYLLFDIQAHHLAVIPSGSINLLLDYVECPYNYNLILYCYLQFHYLLNTNLKGKKIYLTLVIQYPWVMICKKIFIIKVTVYITHYCRDEAC